jgi:uncharacterized repeat protein (TIGR03803 family)
MHSKHAPLCGATAALAAVIAPSLARAAYSLTTVYNFKSNQTVSPDGGGPHGGLGVDANGMLYGTTFRGGTFGTTGGGGFFETGMTYSFDPVSKSYTALGNMDATGHAVPDSWSNLVPDAAGNMYGTTHAGGANGAGNVFVVSASTHSVSTVVSMAFSNLNSHGGLVSDGSGNFDLATDSGIYTVNLSTQALTLLGSFPASAGSDSYGNLYRDSSGNIYGINSAGGTSSDGTIFKMNGSTHVVSTVLTFNGSNGATPEGGLVADTHGNLYGTTSAGGTGGKGTVFEFDPSTNNLSTLVNFDGTTNGSTPICTLVIDSLGNLYGSTGATLFEIDGTTHAYAQLASFSGTGISKVSGNLVMDSQGDIFGTAFSGGTNAAGVIFEASPIPEPHAGILLAFAPLLMTKRQSRQGA